LIVNPDGEAEYEPMSNGEFASLGVPTGLGPPSRIPLT